jgi:anti-sigma factor RsiW
MIESFHEITLCDDDIMRYALDNERLSMEAEEHLKTCEGCQQRIAHPVRLNATLLARLYRAQCPGVARLSWYCIGTLPADDVLSIAAHLRKCPLCAVDVAEMQHFLIAADTED